jgi:hypothetical protein
MFYQDTIDNMVLMIHLNPVTHHDDSIKRGLFATDTDLLSKLKGKTFKEILLTDATMEDGEVGMIKYFGVQKQWDQLLDQWYKENKEVRSYKQYYKLLFLVKSSSMVDHVWFSFFEGMHCHAAIIAGLVCSKFDHTTNELKPGSLTLDDFRNEGAVRISRFRALLSRNIWTRFWQKNSTHQCFTMNFTCQCTFQNRLWMQIS